MRFTALAALFLLGGCAGIEDLGKKLSVATGAISSAIDADVALEYDLLRDFRRKSEQLRFISSDTYSCGDPNDTYTSTVDSRNPPSAKEFKEKLRKEIDKQVAQLELFIHYGKDIEELSKGSAEFQTTSNKVATTLKTLAAFEPTGEGKAFAAAYEIMTQIANTAVTQITNAQIYFMAVKMHDALVKASNDLKEKKNLSRLTASETRAYKLWNACARERLAFIRDCAPPERRGCPNGYDYNRINWSLRRGITRSSAAEFMASYSVYIGERETFLARRPDYGELVDAVIVANGKIIKNPNFDGVLDFINNGGTAAKDLQDKVDKLRAIAEGKKV